MLDVILDVLFPPRCFGCGVHLLADERDERCCERCRHTVHLVESPMCPVCALPQELRRGQDTMCGRCVATRPRYEAVRARWIYDGAVSDAIRRSKAGGDPSSLFALIESDRGWFDGIAAELAGRRWTTPPVHPRDLRARGWDPGRTSLRCAFGGRVDVGEPLRKVRTTTKQARLGRAARGAALRGAFECEDVEGDWVVFDDVMTTGATLQEAARALRRAGARNVIGVVLARSV